MADNLDKGGVSSNSFSRGMLKDFNESLLGEGFYTHARNAVNNSHDGQSGVIGNEPSNLHCIDLPYDLIGTIHLRDDQWVVFTTDDNNSEIGIFDESACLYTKKVNSRCLNFKRAHLITGAFRYRYDCETLIYWDDGINPTRTIDIDNIQQYYKYTDKVINGCIERTYTTEFNCEAIRMASFISHPCLRLKKGNISGTIPNGSYQVLLAYTINQVKVSDYIGLSEVQSIFTHENTSSSLEVNVEGIDKTFDEFQLILLSNVNSQTTAKVLGYYSTTQGTIYIDRLDPESQVISISDVVFRSEAVEKSDAMYNVGSYLLRMGVYSKYKFNYQQQANAILAKWVAVQYPADYYHKGGNNVGYMRDEQYAFFIRWIYNTGERSESYHIPGRAPMGSDNSNIIDADSFEVADGIKRKTWQVQNTARISSLTNYPLGDGGTVIASGRMGYWESTELYPADKPEIWGDLCGKPIRHHKTPDVTVNDILNHYNSSGQNIVVLGVQFEKITHPLDQFGNPIEAIVGYEILRGSREGNKSIVAKGLLNNMREYTIPENTTVKGLYQNYPYNDLRPDSYLTAAVQTGENASNDGNTKTKKLSVYKKNIFSFHSPEVSFTNPYLASSELKIYQEVYGTAIGSFQVPYKHPKFKFPSNFTDILTKIVGALVSAANVIGTFAGADGVLALQGDSDLPLTNNLLLQHKPNFAIGTSPGAFFPNPVVAAQNTTISLFNGIIAAAMFPLTTQATAEQLYKLILAIIPKRQYAAQYNSHGFYSESATAVVGARRRKVIDQIYVKSSINQFNNEYQINNVNRSGYVTIQVATDIEDPVNTDNSRMTMGEANRGYNQSISSTISSRYGALKLSIPSQYGQLESIKQLPISECISPIEPVKGKENTTVVMFGGDTYINRFTEKNSMVFFTDWLMGQPDLTEHDYTLYSSIPYPRFWVNSNSLAGGLFSLASKRRALDNVSRSTFYLKGGTFYLFNSGVRDFFVESEVNLAYRDWEELPSKRHYDPYRFTDLTSMFRSDIMGSANFYKYDYSLSVSKLFNSFITWGQLLPRDYNPVVAASCYLYQPLRMIYSLPIQSESKKDGWRAFLTNNYYDFDSQVTAVKSINKTGAIFMMKYASPMSFMGVEELQLDGTNTKITVGDGKLFDNNKQLQSIVNTDVSFEYGSNQSRFAAIGTLYGIFWVSQNQGKIFNYSNQLDDITNSGLKWWFAKYLPSQLLKTYTDYPMYDNPLVGVGVTVIYDNTNEILYVSKKDYLPLQSDYTYDEDGQFYHLGFPISLTDENYFEDASFTVSYDVKNKVWVSYHDWIPTFLLPGKNHFLSVKGGSIWKHNIRCDSYCNFYGIDYPFEVEFVSATGQQVVSMRNIEYLLEAYKYSNDCRDKFHILDENFDQAIIYNSEQISGLLKLEIKAKNDPLSLLTYPKLGADSITINFSKEENKYRFNQFWDVTRDRGEFTGDTTPMFNVDPSGYKFDINSNYVNYDKSAIERKKFRHNVNRVFLRKTVSGDVKILFKLSNQKILPSYR